MKNWTVRTRIIGAFAAVIAIMLALGAMSYTGLRTIRAQAGQIERDVLPGVVVSAQSQSLAREIRRLADQTAIATFDIEQIVKEMQSAVSAGVMGIDKFADEVRRGREAIGEVTLQLTEIISQVQTLPPSFESVNEGVQSQAISAAQISEALDQLSVASQQTADSLRQSNMAIEQLNDAARGLQNGVARLVPAV